MYIIMKALVSVAWRWWLTVTLPGVEWQRSASVRSHVGGGASSVDGSTVAVTVVVGAKTNNVACNTTSYYYYYHYHYKDAFWN